MIYQILPYVSSQSMPRLKGHGIVSQYLRGTLAAAEIIATFLRAASHNLRYTGIDVLARMVRAKHHLWTFVMPIGSCLRGCNLPCS